ncbi:MAG: hypothetical protein IPK03_15320 [Bacteroidetes bacterium]|nr:hypothetical protein [Bacteroidota bacterium]
MKFILLFSFNILILFSIFSQNISLKDMTLLINMDNDDFDNYVLNKGFTFYSNRNSVEYLGAQYCYNQSKNSLSPSCEKIISYLNGKDGYQNSVSYGTPFVKEYLQIKIQLKTLGFSYKETNQKDKETIDIIYTKGKYLIYLTSYQNNHNGYLMTSYNITLIHNKF